MDVRCEKCQTVYDFDDAKVTEAGVTVKCTQCGNLFRVRRRSTFPIIPTVGANGTARPAPPVPQPRRQTPPPVRDDRREDRTWLLRSAATKEVRRFRELTTLQQW